MLGVIDRWYKRKFSDPDAMMLLVLIIISTLILLFWGSLLMPVIVAVVVAYLLDWLVTQAEKVCIRRTFATALVLILFFAVSVVLLVALLPVVTKQSANLIREIPAIWQQAQSWLMTLPEKYPSYIQYDAIERMMGGINERAVAIGQELISLSFTSLGNLAALLIYLILVPLMVFFMLKDKQVLLQGVSRFLPKERRLINKVGSEMNTQIANYIRGKVIEIIIVGAVSVITFLILDLRYAVLLGVLVGLSVLIPYIGAAVVTIPVAAVALFQFGLTTPFWTLMIAYAIIQALDGNLLVPLLFSEAVSLHPLYIIIAVLFFGGLWGFWGVFFAIPLATLVKAVVNAWSSTPIGTEPQTTNE
ncbi:AI-2E family transporter [Alteromonas facilis]|uniref:AI-2E family transporter n=1 Tax=Alteromonas facilis TaxID=2048004 RepID=UPI000C291D6F|nr:AI-2E family transporter [Alteromonas facilis]